MLALVSRREAVPRGHSLAAMARELIGARDERRREGQQRGDAPKLRKPRADKGVPRGPRALKGTKAYQIGHLSLLRFRHGRASMGLDRQQPTSTRATPTVRCRTASRTGTMTGAAGSRSALRRPRHHCSSRHEATTGPFAAVPGFNLGADDFVIEMDVTPQTPGMNQPAGRSLAAIRDKSGIALVKPHPRTSRGKRGTSYLAPSPWCCKQRRAGRDGFPPNST